MKQPGGVLGGRFTIDAVLGKGGMGAVYRAMHPTLDVPVAIKEMMCLLSDPRERDSAVDQFRREARILHHLSHPNLPVVYDFFEADQQYYFVMDLVEGETLGDRFKRSETRDPRIVLEWSLQLCDVLDYLHNNNPPIIFRDLKPSNIMLQKDGRIKLIDFGIAKLLDPATGRGTADIARGAGSMDFCPLEQYGQATDHRSDIYSLGATIYCLLSGTLPPTAVDRTVSGNPVQPLTELNPAVPMRLWKLVSQMMELQAQNRPHSVAMVRDELRAILATLKLDEWAVDAPPPPPLQPPPPPPPDMPPTLPLARVETEELAPSVPATPAPNRSVLWMALGVIAVGGLTALLARQPERPAPTPSPPAPPPIAAPASPTPPPMLVVSQPVGTLRVETSVPGAEVFVDGKSGGGVPIDLELPVGRHAIEVRHPSYRTWSGTVTLREGKTEVLKPRLIAGPPILMIGGESGGTVFLNGVARGRTPLVLNDLPPGSIEVRIEWKDSDPFTQKVTLQNGRTVRVQGIRQAKSLVIRPGDGVESIHLGMDTQAVLKSLKEPYTMRPEAELDIYEVPTLALILGDARGKVGTIEVTDRRYVTREGVRVGDGAAQVQGTYGAAPQVVPGPGCDFWVYRNHGLVVVVAEGRVLALRVISQQ